MKIMKRSGILLQGSEPFMLAYLMVFSIHHLVDHDTEHDLKMESLYQI